MSTIPIRQIKDSFFEERFSIRNLEPLTSDKDLVHELHRHDFYFVLFVKTGSGQHEIDFVKHPVSNYNCFFIRPGQVHELLLSQGTTGFMLQFTTDFYTPKEIPALEVLRKVSHQNFLSLASAEFEQIESIATLIFQEYAQKSNRYKEALKSYLDILFIVMARFSQTEQTEHKLYAQERLDALFDLMEKNISSKKQVSDYAEMLHITSYQLNSITKSLLQKTASELINEHIILEAKRLLIATTNQVNQVAHLLGYDDTSYFIRFFKKKTGLTPEAFRQHFK